MTQFKFKRDHIDAGVFYAKDQTAGFEPETITALLASGAGEIVKLAAESKPSRPRETRQYRDD